MHDWKIIFRASSYTRVKLSSGAQKPPLSRKSEIKH
jgi:hypothetical protein